MKIFISWSKAFYKYNIVKMRNNDKVLAQHFWNWLQRTQSGWSAFKTLIHEFDLKNKKKNIWKKTTHGMNEMFWNKLLNSSQVPKGRKLVNDVGGDTVLDGRALEDVVSIQASRNRHRLTQNRLKCGNYNDSAFFNNC